MSDQRWVWGVGLATTSEDGTVTLVSNAGYQATLDWEGTYGAEVTFVGVPLGAYVITWSDGCTDYGSSNHSTCSP